MDSDWQAVDQGNSPLRWALGKFVMIGVICAVGAVVLTSNDGSFLGPRLNSLEDSSSPVQASEPESAGRRTLTILGDERGHFWLDGQVDGANVRFMVDTGASGVALDRDTAERAGFHLVDRDFTGRSQTASGVARTAPVTLRRLKIGPMTLRNVNAHVVDGTMNGMGLLGMSVLRRLDSYEVSANRLYLRW